MKHPSGQKLIRLGAVIAAAAALLLFGKPAPGPSGPGLDLVPELRRGLDLAFYAPKTDGHTENGVLLSPLSAAGSKSESLSLVEVWNGTEAVLMPLEDYIIGVTAGEVPASFELEALRAQAVAARTFTLKHMVGEARCKSGHTICTDPGCCQAFADEARMRELWGDSYDKYLARIREAVLSTAGEVLTSDGELVTALYHSCAGGRTEDCEAVFAVALPYLVSVESEGEEGVTYEKTYTAKEFTERINAAFPDALMTDPKKEVEVWERTGSGRISLIRLGGTVRTGQQLRTALKLKSTNVLFDITEDTVRLTCIGSGHGVGMSQLGANAMAARGADYEEILKHYYTGVELVSIDALIGS